ncbi:MAG TPA: endo alpha-1,4 polygalactosaminidase [Candidatus Dormibacteraeota bacterium]|nr:endo alpha-1,4 polygalactosaminidase [Candidatus Dormibacteraeota bacterium]
MPIRPSRILALAILISVAGCGGGTAATRSSGASPTVPASAPSTGWSPARIDTYQWQLSGTIDTTIAASVYDLDAFDTAAQTVTALHQLGRHVVCYVDTGTYENWRPDAPSFQANPVVIGSPDSGWPGEYWLDIRRIDILGPIVEARFDLCKAKGFDAIEPDNIDGYQNQTGFPLTATDQLTYNRWLAAQAHARGLGIALKNDSDQASALEPSFDWSLDEDCYAQGWCAALAPFTTAGKAVVAVEYDDALTPAQFAAGACPAAALGGYQTILKHRLLDAWRQSCP